MVEVRTHRSSLDGVIMEDELIKTQDFVGKTLYPPRGGFRVVEKIMTLKHNGVEYSALPSPTPTRPAEHVVVRPHPVTGGNIPVGRIYIEGERHHSMYKAKRDSFTSKRTAFEWVCRMDYDPVFRGKVK